MNDYKNYYGALPLCIVPKTPSVTEYCNRNILRNTYLHAFLLFPASPLISNDTKPTKQNYFDLTLVSNFTITECKTNSINTQIKPFVPHLVLVSSHLTCTRQSTQAKARLQAQENGKFAFVFLCLWMRVAPVYT